LPRFAWLPLLALAPAPPGADKPVGLKPGLYAVVCGHMGLGATRTAALRACERAIRVDRALDARRCSCAAHADVVELLPARKPAFFVTPDGHTGATRALAIEACLRDPARRAPDAGAGSGCDSEVIAAYGPFDRKRSRAGFDDETVYRYLGEDGSWYDSSGQRPCFVAGTPVLVRGGTRPIEGVAVGDHLVSWSDGAPADATVLAVKRRRVREVLELELADGRTLRLTGNHPLLRWRDQTWTPAADLTVGDALAVFSDGQLVPVTIAHRAIRAGELDVFDLTVSPTHSYFAAGVWAHNY
jgi:hypothetical protein